MLNPGSVEVWIVDLRGRQASDFQPILNGTEWQKAMRFRFPSDQRRSAVTRGALRTLLSRYLGCRPNEFLFTQNEFGKPALAGAQLQFNVSHSGDYALLAFTHGSAVGVDVEQIKGARVVSDLAQRVLTAAEFACFQLVGAAESRPTFFQIWTLKESVLKAIGSGLSVPPEDIEIDFNSTPPRLLSALTPAISDVAEWTLSRLAIGNVDYAAAVAIHHKAPTVTLNQFES